MASRMDVQKRRAWEGRLRRYQASGLTVTRFCEKERVSTHAFYYWAKRIGAAKRVGSSSVKGAAKRAATTDKRSAKHVATAVVLGRKSRQTSCRSKHVAGFTRPVKHVSTAVGNSNMAWVHFRWNAAMEVLVPANCLGAIRCLAECLGHASIERDTAEHTDAFQEVVVR